MSKPILTSAHQPTIPLMRRARSIALLAVLAGAPLTAGVSSAQQQTTAPSFPMPQTSSGLPTTGVNSRSDDPISLLANERRIKELNILRQKQLTSDAAKLLVLATELKANVDKGQVDDSSLELMHKAEQIEKLARSVRTRMTDAAGN